jgi:hypothetical protein
MGTDGNLNFGGGSTSNTVTFFTVKDPAGIIAVNVSTPTRNHSRNVAAGGATC